MTLLQEALKNLEMYRLNYQAPKFENSKKQMTKQEQLLIAKKVNGLLGQGKLNWMGDFDYSIKKEQFSVFFTKEAQAKKAMDTLSKYGDVRLIKTPKSVNVAFKFSIIISLP